MSVKHMFIFTPTTNIDILVITILATLTQLLLRAEPAFHLWQAVCGKFMGKWGKAMCAL